MKKQAHGFCGLRTEIDEYIKNSSWNAVSVFSDLIPRINTKLSLIEQVQTINYELSCLSQLLNSIYNSFGFTSIEQLSMKSTMKHVWTLSLWIVFILYIYKCFVFRQKVASAFSMSPLYNNHHMPYFIHPHQHMSYDTHVFFLQMWLFSEIVELNQLKWNRTVPKLWFSKRTTWGEEFCWH